MSEIEAVRVWVAGTGVIFVISAVLAFLFDREFLRPGYSVAELDKALKWRQWAAIAAVSSPAWPVLIVVLPVYFLVTVVDTLGKWAYDGWQRKGER